MSNALASNTDIESEKFQSDNKTFIQLPQSMELYKDGLKDIYWAEKAMINAIPKMIKETNSKEVNEAISTHFEDIKKHMNLLEKYFTSIEENDEVQM